MIDEKSLDELLAKGLANAPLTRGDFPSIRVAELVRLARLGLWAEKHAIPAMKGTPCQSCDRGHAGAQCTCADGPDLLERVGKALAALPAVPK